MKEIQISLYDILNTFSPRSKILSESNIHSAVTIIEHLKRLYYREKNGGWCSASQINREIGLNIATAVSNLKKLHSINLLEKREVRGGTRKMFEYRVKQDVNFILTYRV